jgi:hypothetical protein
LGGTDLTRKFYDAGTIELKVRIIVEDEDVVNEDKETLDKERRIDSYDNCLPVLEFKKDIEVMEKMKNFRLNVNDAVATGAGVANSQHKCMQDTAAMDRMMSLRTNIKDYELGLRKRLFSETNATRNSLCDEYTSDDNE